MPSKNIGFNLSKAWSAYKTRQGRVQAGTRAISDGLQKRRVLEGREHFARAMSALENIEMNQSPAKIKIAKRIFAADTILGSLVNRVLNKGQVPVPTKMAKWIALDYFNSNKKNSTNFRMLKVLIEKEQGKNVLLKATDAERLIQMNANNLERLLGTDNAMAFTASLGVIQQMAREEERRQSPNAK